ncbi:MAG: hypothetical protein IJH57_04880 [Mogibacterium sp.]|nr:hypothetical protein [Mogibacterium sp.]
MLKKLIRWIKSCFAGDAAISKKSKAEFNNKMADHKARNRGWRGPLNG